MKTLIVTHGGLVRFLVTNHPVYRFEKLQSQMPVEVVMFGVTDTKSKDIKLRFASNQVTASEWYRLSDELEQYLSTLVRQS